jgi:hypothetical protein
MKQRQKYRSKSHIPTKHLTLIEFRAITFVSTLVLAGLTIMLRIQEPVVWGFLGTAIGMSLGQIAQNGKS